MLSITDAKLFPKLLGSLSCLLIPLSVMPGLCYGVTLYMLCDIVPHG